MFQLLQTLLLKMSQQKVEQFFFYLYLTMYLLTLFIVLLCFFFTFLIVPSWGADLLWILREREMVRAPRLPFR